MKIKALVANSSPKERKNITKSLNEIGVRGVEAADRNEALELLQNDKFDMVIAEFNAQGGDSQELVNAARKINNTLPIIVTAPQSKNLNEVKQALPNASTYLSTPFTAQQLRETVGEFIPSIAS
jgi:DNA-binding NtrC family response regulator